MPLIRQNSHWNNFYSQVEAFFSYDPDVHILYDPDTYVLSLYVDEEKKRKAVALRSLLPDTIIFDGQEININVFPETSSEEMSKFERYYAAFENNLLVSKVIHVPNLFLSDLTYIIFKPTIVQFDTHCISDYLGKKSILPEDMATFIFVEEENVYYTTDRFPGLDQPEWP